MRSRVIGAAVASLLVLVGAAGCGDDHGEHAGAHPGATGSTSAGGRSSDAAQAETETVQPASGDLTGIEGMLSIRLTTDLDWQVSESGGSVYASGSRPGVGPIEMLADDHYTANTTIDEELKYHLQTLRRTTAFTYRRLAERTVGDVEGYVIVGKRAHGYRFYEWGTIRNGRSVLINFTYNASYAGAEDLISSVLASVEWVTADQRPPG